MWLERGKVWERGTESEKKFEVGGVDARGRGEGRLERVFSKMMWGGEGE